MGATVKRILGIAAAILVGGASVAAPPGPAAADPDGPSARGQLDDFVFARAAAEACLGVTLAPPEQDRFIEFLSIRDPRRRPLPDLADDVRRRLREWRGDIERSGCHAAPVRQALTTWSLRVTTLAGIAGEGRPTAGPSDDGAGPAALSARKGTLPPNG